MASSPTIAGTPSISLLEAPPASAMSRSSSWRSSSSRLSPELNQERLDANPRRGMLNKSSDSSADEVDVLAWKSKQKDGSPSPNNSTQAVRGFSP